MITRARIGCAALIGTAVVDVLTVIGRLLVCGRFGGRVVAQLLSTRLLIIDTGDVNGLLEISVKAAGKRSKS
jgi:hypothetical protein